MAKCYNCGAEIKYSYSMCSKCAASAKGTTYTTHSTRGNVKGEGSFALGFILGWFISGPLIWLIALIADKEETRKGAFWCTVVQILLGILIVFIY